MKCKEKCQSTVGAVGDGLALLEAQMAEMQQKRS